MYVVYNDALSLPTYCICVHTQLLAFIMCVCVYFFLILEKSYHVYDGFVFPSQKWVERIHQYTSNTGINTKNAWGNALTIYLQHFKLNHFETEDFDISGTCETICDIYFHIKYKSFLPFQGENKPISLSDTEHLNNGVRKVCDVLALCVILYKELQRISSK